MRRFANIRKCDEKDIDPDRPEDEQKYCLYAKSSGKLLGRHSTIDEAEQQEAAIHARGGSPKMIGQREVQALKQRLAEILDDAREYLASTDLPAPIEDVYIDPRIGGGIVENFGGFGDHDEAAYASADIRLDYRRGGKVLAEHVDVDLSVEVQGDKGIVALTAGPVSLVDSYEFDEHDLTLYKDLAEFLRNALPTEEGEPVGHTLVRIIPEAFARETKREGSTKMKKYIRLAEVPESAVKSLYQDQWGQNLMKSIGDEVNIDSKAAQFLFFTAWNGVIQLMDKMLQEKQDVDTSEYSKDPSFMQALAGLAYFVTDDALKSAMGVKSDSLGKAKGHVETLMQLIGKEAPVDKTLEGLKAQAKPIAEKAFDALMDWLKQQPAKEQKAARVADAKDKTAARRALVKAAFTRSANAWGIFWMPQAGKNGAWLVGKSDGSGNIQILSTESDLASEELIELATKKVPNLDPKDISVAPKTAKMKIGTDESGDRFTLTTEIVNPDFFDTGAFGQEGRKYFKQLRTKGRAEVDRDFITTLIEDLLDQKMSADYDYEIDEDTQKDTRLYVQKVIDELKNILGVEHIYAQVDTGKTASLADNAETAIRRYIDKELERYGPWFESEAGAYYSREFTQLVEYWVENIAYYVDWAEESGTGDVTGIDESYFAQRIAQLLFKIAPEWELEATDKGEMDIYYDLKEIEDSAIELGFDVTVGTPNTLASVDAKIKKWARRKAGTTGHSALWIKEVVNVDAKPEKWVTAAEQEGLYIPASMVDTPYVNEYLAEEMNDVLAKDLKEQSRFGAVGKFVFGEGTDYNKNKWGLWFVTPAVEDVIAMIAPREKKQMSTKKEKIAGNTHGNRSDEYIRYAGHIYRLADDDLDDMDEGADDFRDRDAKKISDKVVEFFKGLGKKASVRSKWARTAKRKRTCCGPAKRSRKSGNKVELPTDCVEQLVGARYSDSDTTTFEKKDDTWFVEGVDSQGVIDDMFVQMAQSTCEMATTAATKRKAYMFDDGFADDPIEHEFDVPFSCLLMFYGVTLEEYLGTGDIYPATDETFPTTDNTLVTIYKKRGEWHASVPGSTGDDDYEFAPRNDQEAKELERECSYGRQAATKHVADYTEFEVPFDCLVSFYGVSPDEYPSTDDTPVTIYKEDGEWHASVPGSTGDDDYEFAPRSDQEAKELERECSHNRRASTKRIADQMNLPGAYEEVLQYDPNYRGIGKFDSNVDEWVYSIGMEGGEEDSISVGEGAGYYELHLFPGTVLVEEPQGSDWAFQAAILFERSDGIVEVSYVDTVAEAIDLWKELEDELAVEEDDFGDIY